MLFLLGETPYSLSGSEASGPQPSQLLREGSVLRGGCELPQISLGKGV